MTQLQILPSFPPPWGTPTLPSFRPGGCSSPLAGRALRGTTTAGCRTWGPPCRTWGPPCLGPASPLDASELHAQKAASRTRLVSRAARPNPTTFALAQDPAAQVLQQDVRRLLVGGRHPRPGLPPGGPVEPRALARPPRPWRAQEAPPRPVTCPVPCGFPVSPVG